MSRHKANRKEDILNAARNVFAEKGVENSKISDIVARAGIAQGTFYLYFPNKLAVLQGLKKQLEDELFAQLEPIFVQALPLKEVIVQAISGTILVLSQHQDILKMLHTSVLLEDDWQLWSDVRQPYYSIVTLYLKEAQKRGEILPDIKPEILSPTIVEMVHRYAEECCLSIRHSQSEDIEQLAGFIARGLSANT